MNFDIDKFTKNSKKLEYEDIDFSSFVDQPLAPEVIRSLKYFADVEFHTICYLRDLLVTRAHQDPTVTAFLTFWNYEEYFHGEVLSDILALHGVEVGPPHIKKLRLSLGAKNQIGPLKSMFGSLLFKEFIALHMSWGAINEYSTQTGYARLIAKANHPEFTKLLKRIMKQEGRHIDFYASQAKERLAVSNLAQKTTRFIMQKSWAPVGSGVMPEKEVDFLLKYLFDDEAGKAAALRIDKQMNRFPGLENMNLVEKALAKHGL